MPVNREQALAHARAEATRDLIEEERTISFVCYVPDLFDYFRAAFSESSPGEWVCQYEVLPHEERLPEERITDSRIADVARAGNRIMAIRLYRVRYDTDLATASREVSLLVESAAE